MNELYRVVLVHRDRYLVRNGTKEYYCVLTGSLRYRDEYPVVGDYVQITVNPYGDSLIQSICPRRTAFFRPDRGGHADGFAKTVQVQPLIANMDYVFIMTSLNHDFSLNPNGEARERLLCFYGRLGSNRTGCRQPARSLGIIVPEKTAFSPEHKEGSYHEQRNRRQDDYH